MIVAKLRGARERVKAKRGRCEGRKPYGTFEGEKETLGRMHEMRSARLSFDAIAVRLNEEGRKARSKGKPWHGKVVNRILTGRR
jgi:hypothetical protein